jgi:hypothetical protein
MSVPLIGREAVVKKDNVEIGYLTGLTLGIDIDLIKAYKIGSDKPIVLSAGNKTFTLRIDKMYIDNAYASDVLGGTPVSIEVQPAGTGVGKPKITLSNVVFTSWELSVEQDGVIMERVEGEAGDITFATQ